MSQFVGVVMAPRRSSVFKHIEFVKLSEHRVLLIIVSPQGDVQNRVLFTDVEFDASELTTASNFINTHYAGLDIEEVRERIKQEVVRLQGEVVKLMQSAVNLGAEAMMPGPQEQVIISGERNLLSVSDFSSDMGNLRRAFELFEQRPRSCVCSMSPARPKACVSILVAKARSCLLRSCRLSVPHMKWMVRWLALWA